MPPPVMPDASLTIDEIVARYPEAITVFNRLGVDVCCGGAMTLAESAEADGLDLEDVQEALRAAIPDEVPADKR